MKIQIELEPNKDEILSSWLIRNSIANGSDPTSFMSGIWPNFRVWSRDIGRHLPSDKINSLSKVTSLSIEQIRDMTLEPIIENITSDYSLNPKKAWLYVIPTGHRGTIDINGTQFCKECLKKEKTYIKKQWRLAWNLACPIHKDFLLCKCQKCNATFSPHKIDYINTHIYKCANCNFDLRLSSTLPANNEIILFQEKLNSAAFNNIVDKTFPLIQYNQSELFLTIRTLIPLLKNLYNLKKYKQLFERIGFNITLQLSKYPKGTTFEAMSIKDREQLLLIVSKFLALNIDEIKQFFTETNIPKHTITSHISINSKTLSHLTKDLSNHKNRLLNSKKTPKITPRSKDEVELLMKEIDKFL